MENTTKKEKVPSSFSSTICLSSSYYNNQKYINFSLLGKSCGRKSFHFTNYYFYIPNWKLFAENRTRDFRLTGKYFTTKLLAHNDSNTKLNYLNLSL